MAFSPYGRTALAKESCMNGHGATFSGIALAYNVRQDDDLLNYVAAPGGMLVKAAEEVS